MYGIYNAHTCNKATNNTLTIWYLSQYSIIIRKSKLKYKTDSNSTYTVILMLTVTDAWPQDI